MSETPDPRRRTFGPSVLAGLATGAVCAVAGSRTWAAPAAGTTDDAGDRIAAVALSSSSVSAPVVTALALVVLACWGVVLMTRGRVRRVVAALGLVAAAGVLVSAVGRWLAAPDDVRALYAAYGVSVDDAGRGVWAHVAVVAAVLALATWAYALRAVPGWPEMGRRYDAPVAEHAAPASPPLEEQSNIEVWKAIDEGRDPT